MEQSGNGGDGGPQQGADRAPLDSWEDVAEGAGADRSSGAAAADRPRVSSVDVSQEAARLKGLRLLVIDSSPTRLEAARPEVEQLGIELAVGGPDESGYRRALEFHPDAVLSDLTTPGEPGWWLFQRFRRHPLLKWTPILLMRWFEGDSHAVVMLVARVVERINEVLAPIRVLEDRIAAGRALADRVEVTGMPALLRLLRTAKLTGVLSVNDSWNVFEVALREGSLSSTVRRGVDGETDRGDEAFLQLLLCDSGRWSFRSQDPGTRSDDMPRDLTASIDRAGRVLGSVIGPAADVGSGAEDRLEVRQLVMRDLASSLSGVGRQLVEGIADGVSRAEIDGMVSQPGDLVSAERALISLMRCGAVRPVLEPRSQPRDDDDDRVARSVVHLLSKVARDHRFGADEAVEDGAEVEGSARSGKEQERGYYRVSRVLAERVALKAREGMSVPGANVSDASSRFQAPPADSGRMEWEGGMPTPVLEPDSAAWAAGMGSSTVTADPERGAGVMPHDTLVPGPAADSEDRGRRQMWLALALALLLGGLLVIGLIVIGSS